MRAFDHPAPADAAFQSAGLTRVRVGARMRYWHAYSGASNTVEARDHTRFPETLYQREPVPREYE